MFRRDLHVAWAETLERLERFEEAAREYGVAQSVPAKLDPDHVVFTGSPDQLPEGVDPANLPPSILGDLPQDLLEPVPLTEEEREELAAGEARCTAQAESRR